MTEIEERHLIGQTLCKSDRGSYDFLMITGVNHSLAGDELEVAKNYSSYPEYIPVSDVRGLGAEGDYKYELPSEELVRRIFKK